MSQSIQLWWCIAVLELCMWLLPSLLWRRVFAWFVVMGVFVSSVYLCVRHPSMLTVFLFIMSIYRICNMARLIKARMHEKYLRRATRQAGVWIIGVQSILLGLWLINNHIHIPTYHLWLLLGCLNLLFCLVLLASTVRHLRKTQAPRLAQVRPNDHDVPTLTVAIPARNETTDLEACLASIIATDYPKLEVLVLDDCSQMRRTPEIIRSFAHSGVRFLQGTPPENNWLAKNQGYQQLLEEANGDLILFCGVDVRFTPTSFSQLVATMVQKNKSMISIIPKNVSLAGGRPSTATMFVQPMRYVWELALPRKLFRRPPVLSTCWIAKREIINAAGGFAAVSRSIVPESYFARVSAVHDGYSFMQADATMGITSAKGFGEQCATAVRTRYPQVHRRMELVMLLTITELLSVLLPYALALLGLLGRLSVQLTIISLCTIVVLTVIYASVVCITYRTWLSRSIVMLPLAICIDAIFLNYSMIRYEFFDVIWKGRNVCIPVMYVVDKLRPDEQM